MKFFHLSDLHIGLRLMNRDLIEDQAFIFDQITGLAKIHQPDAVVIAGDIYDKAIPSAEAVSLFDRFVTKLKEAAPSCVIMMISGNHDSAPRVNVFRTLLDRQGIHMIGIPPLGPEDHIEKVTLEDESGPVHFYLLPFVRPSMVRPVLRMEPDARLSYDEALKALIGREQIDTTQRNVLVSHQFYLPAGTDPETVERTDSEIRTVGNIDEVCADVLKPFDYAALGHIHKPMKAGSEFCRYSGTPLACSVSEAGQEKGIILVQMGEKGTVSTQVLPLKPLHQVRVLEGSLEEVLAAPSDDYVRIVLTDKTDLDVIDMQEKLRRAFPGLLEIRRSGVLYEGPSEETDPYSIPDAFTLCCDFLGELTDEEKALLQGVIDKAAEVRE